MYSQYNFDTKDYSYLRHSGWHEDLSTKKVFSQDTVNLISQKVTELTRGVYPGNKKIIIPDENIYQTLDGVYAGIRRHPGDIFTRFIIPNDTQENLVQSVIDQTIEVITSNIRNNIGMDDANQKLTPWVQLYGDFNMHELRQHAPIKVRDRRPATMQFFQNY